MDNTKIETERHLAAARSNIEELQGKLQSTEGTLAETRDALKKHQETATKTAADHETTVTSMTSKHERSLNAVTTEKDATIAKL